MTISRVGNVVPFLAKTAPTIAAVSTTRQRSCGRAGDRDNPAAIGETRQRRSNAAKCGVRHAALDIGHRWEGRIHQDDARRDGGIEMPPSATT